MSIVITGMNDPVRFNPIRNILEHAVTHGRNYGPMRVRHERIKRTEEHELIGMGYGQATVA